MNGVHAPHQGRRPHLWRAGLRALALVSFAFLAAACDGSSASPGVASIGSTTSTTSALGTASSFGEADLQQSYQAQLAYATCMRSHGEPSFPDPVLTGQSVRFGAGHNIDQDSPRFVSASTTCKRLVPEGGTPSPAQIQAMIAQMVKNAECMRAHGVTNFPDPTVNVPGMLAGFSLKGLDPNSPQFQAAQKACQRLAPLGAGG
jgi:hypothetical protein